MISLLPILASTVAAASGFPPPLYTDSFEPDFDPTVKVISAMFRREGGVVDPIVENIAVDDVLVPEIWLMVQSETQPSVETYIRVFFNGESHCEGPVSFASVAQTMIACLVPITIVDGVNQLSIHVTCVQFDGRVTPCDSFAARQYDTNDEDTIDHIANDVFLRDVNGFRVDSPRPGQIVTPSINVTLFQSAVFYYSVAFSLDDSIIDGCSEQVPVPGLPGPVTVTVDCDVQLTFPDSGAVKLRGIVDPSDEIEETSELNNAVSRTVVP